VSESILLKSGDDNEFNILKSDDLIIGGYASIEIVDKQNDLITLKALEKAVIKYMKDEKYRNVMSNHSNVQVGDVIEKYRDKNGNLHRTQVDDVGFYVVIKLRDDIEKAKEISRGIRKGTLRSFSIGGQALSKRKKSNEELGEYNEIDELELHEVTICEKGINPEAKFDILKEEKDKMSEKLEKALEELNGLMTKLSDFKKEESDMGDEEKMSMKEKDEEKMSMDDDKEKMGYESMDSDEEDLEMADKDLEMAEMPDDMERKGRTGPEGFVENAGAGTETQGKKHEQAGQLGSLYKEWSDDEFATLDLSSENVEKAYAAFKAEQLEKMAYDSLKDQFAARFASEQTVRKAEVARSEYDAKNEVEALREEFATLRKSLSEQTDTIAKANTVEIPDVNVSEMSWAEINNFVSRYEE
jgi:HK97 family phage prohead protease